MGSCRPSRSIVRSVIVSASERSPAGPAAETRPPKRPLLAIDCSHLRTILAGNCPRGLRAGRGVRAAGRLGRPRAVWSPGGPPPSVGPAGAAGFAPPSASPLLGRLANRRPPAPAGFWRRPREPVTPRRSVRPLISQESAAGLLPRPARQCCTFRTPPRYPL